MDFSKLEHPCTNENLGAIVAGLDIQPRDRVLAVAGSGDQPLALLEKAAFVKAVDINFSQIDYFKQRVRALKAGDYDSFLKSDLDPDWVDIFTCSDFAKANLVLRNKYFSESKRLNRIRANLGNLAIAKPQNILDVIEQENGFSKVYLSNIIDCSFISRELSLILGKLAQRLPSNGLIYVANHETLFEIANPDRAKNGDYKKYGLDACFLPPEFCLDLRLTKKVRKYYNGIWSPAVYRRK